MSGKNPISKAPKDEEKKKKWAYHMMRIQVAMWVDGKSKCEECGHIYTSVDDFLERNPRRGFGEDFTFVDDACWEQYLMKQAEVKEK